ncbi:hypothetical protein [Legionella cardiaca]|uniref:23, 7 kDa protein n=1 Tax=Legionella cardiaca TaxID=1071983 RepID=A0ABY8AV73_9GAMM|nr:hypothetical protein [Legionella cardiaca]WED44483.1 hypothetical protein PXX05_06775 [Legionella cardiaca]
MLTFFRQKSKVTKQQIDAALLNALNYFTDEEIITLIRQKQSIFQQQIIQSKHASEKESILLCYALFAKTLMNCVKSPSDIPDFIDHYYTSSYYCHVGGENGCYSYTLFDEVNAALLKTSLAVLVLSFITLPFSIPVSLIALGIAISILLPTGFYAAAETLPNQMKIKKEEDILFHQLYLNLTSQKDLNSPSIESEASLLSAN